ncbi:MAG: Xaa-Pro peptidase family protein [Candidatus Omnitrophota bacterium]|nr:Xaa-Pro peptidase family protein [Candidatus Omnitrophota bacterium]
MLKLNPAGRLASLEAEMKARKLDSFLVTNETNVSYLSGFLGGDSIILATREKDFFLTDSRYIEEARSGVRGFDIELVKLSTYKTLQSIISKNRLKKIGFESMSLPYEVSGRLKDLAPGATFVPIRDLVEGIRSVKDRQEVALIRDSIKLAKAVLERTISCVVPGVTEASLAKKIELEFITHGAEAGFKPIVASGANASKPHAQPGENVIKTNSFAMIDIGCTLRRYNSDITRMVVLGKVSNRFKRIYDVVREAQDKGIAAIKPGERLSKIDKAARNHINAKGFGKHFGHSLGHGVGMEVHESPNVSALSEGIAREGMVFTVEPAIYITGFGGVRIEDMVLVTKNGCEVLTK